VLQLRGRARECPIPENVHFLYCGLWLVAGASLFSVSETLLATTTKILTVAAVVVVTLLF
jgi:hypothetical protein